jgi:hypothetical protein
LDLLELGLLGLELQRGELVGELLLGYVGYILLLVYCLEELVGELLLGYCLGELVGVLLLGYCLDELAGELLLGYCSLQLEIVLELGNDCRGQSLLPFS